MDKLLEMFYFILKIRQAMSEFVKYTAQEYIMDH